MLLQSAQAVINERSYSITDNSSAADGQRFLEGIDEFPLPIQILEYFAFARTKRASVPHSLQPQKGVLFYKFSRYLRNATCVFAVRISTLL